MARHIALAFGDLSVEGFGIPRPTHVPRDVEREIISHASTPDGLRELADLLDVPVDGRQAVVDHALWALDTGRVTYTPRLPSTVIIGPHDHVLHLPALTVEEEEDLSVHALVLLLLDAQERPVAGASYRVIDPDGRTHTGQLDLQGRAEIHDIRSAGACKVSFPQYDNGAWAYVSAHPL